MLKNYVILDMNTNTYYGEKGQVDNINKAKSIDLIVAQALIEGSKGKENLKIIIQQ